MNTSLFDLDIFNEDATSDNDSFNNVMNDLLQECMDIITSPDSDDDLITEATRLSKEIHKMSEKKTRLRDNLRKLSEEQKKYPDNSTEYKLIARKKDKINTSLKEISKNAEELGSEYGDIDSIDSKSRTNGRRKKAGLRDGFLNYYSGSRKERKPGEIMNLHKKLKEMEESVDMILEDVSIPVPGGDKETPNSKPYDAASIGVPGKKEISADVYNDALTRLKKSYKESMELVDILQNVVVTENANLIDRQSEYLGEAILAAFENGPLYEAVDRSDKETVKNIVDKVRTKVKAFAKEHKLNFEEPKHWLGVWFGKLHGKAVGTNLTNDAFKREGFDARWSYSRLWQIVGAFDCESSEIGSIVRQLNKEFKDILGDYKILYVEFRPSRHKGRNAQLRYCLVVDKSLSKQLKKELSELAKETSNDSPKMESVELIESDFGIDFE